MQVYLQSPTHPELQLEVQAAEHFPPQPLQFEPQFPPQMAAVRAEADVPLVPAADLVEDPPHARRVHAEEDRHPVEVDVEVERGLRSTVAEVDSEPPADRVRLPAVGHLEVVVHAIVAVVGVVER